MSRLSFSHGLEASAGQGVSTRAGQVKFSLGRAGGRFSINERNLGGDVYFGNADLAAGGSSSSLTWDREGLTLREEDREGGLPQIRIMWLVVCFFPEKSIVVV